ncbi:hypothetical protein [Paenibacillus agricola]|uniref:Uncharacterized protein n=1 Tax=Paenibacillus agricola TaxID=2716264 RepID=A0ABX0JDI7_9BACL|nr:hypothetical protein [Paenibacillus agricola]NHN33319.1 hypothetical protein [Paenibacillus agricola]
MNIFIADPKEFEKITNLLRDDIVRLDDEIREISNILNKLDNPISSLEAKRNYESMMLKAKTEKKESELLLKKLMDRSITQGIFDVILKDLREIADFSCDPHVNQAIDQIRLKIIGEELEAKYLF